MKTFPHFMRVLLAVFALSRFAFGQALSSFVFDWEGGAAGQATAQIAGGKSAVGVVVLNAAAPAGGITVNLSSNESFLKVWGPTVFVPAGQTKSNTFTLSTIPPTLGQAVLTATGNGGSIEQTVSVVNPIFSLGTSGYTVAAGYTLQGAVTVSPSNSATVVNLSASGVGTTVPATVTVPAGSTHATFVIKTAASIPDSTYVNVSAWVTGYPQVTATFKVLQENPGAGVYFLPAVQLAPNACLDAENIFDLSFVTGQAVTVNLSSNVPGVHVPASIIVQPNHQTANIPLTLTSPLTVNTKVTVTATVAGFAPVQGSVTLIPGWAFQCNGNITTPIAVGSDGMIYCTTYNIQAKQGELYAIYPNGTLKWVLPTNGMPSGPVVHGSVVYVTVDISGDTSVLYAINTDGTNKWHYALPAQTEGFQFAVGPDGTCYIDFQGLYSETSNNQMVYAVSPDGTLKWTYSAAPSYLQTAPAVAPDGTIYAGLTKGDLVALGPTDGKPIWTASAITTSGLLTPTVAKDGTIYVPDLTDHLYQLNSKGSVNWTCELWPVANPLYIGTDDSVYMSTAYGHVVKVSSAGKVVWCPMASPSGQIANFGMAPDGTLYFGDTAKDLIALTPAPLAPVTDWELVAWGDDGISYGFAFAHDDAVYFGTYSGRLICMKWTPAPVSP